MLTVPKEGRRTSRSPSRVSVRSASKERPEAEPAPVVAASPARPTRRSTAVTMPNFGAVVMLKGRFSTFRQHFAARRGHQAAAKQFENTYRVEPTECFRSDLARRYLERSLKFFLDDLPYHPKAAARLSKSISEDVRRKVKDHLNTKRYKLVCYVMIAENRGQTVQAANRCCWNPKFDSWCSAEYQSEHMLASAVFFGVYSE